MKAKLRFAFFSFLVLATLLSACGAGQDEALTATLEAMQSQLDELGGAAPAADSGASTGSTADLGPADVSFTLMTMQEDDQLYFVGVGGEIDGAINPTLQVDPGAVVEITLVNGHAVVHDLLIDEFGVDSGEISQEGEQRTMAFEASQEGSFFYYCSVPGHRLAGMEGLLIVGEPSAAAEGVSVVKNPSDLPGPIGERGPELVQVELVTQEVVGQLADGSTFTYFTFNGTVPGPFIRVRQGDTIEVTLTNSADSKFVHSVDLHSVTGPGGGAVYTQTQPGESNTFTFQALNPGIYVYHCATPSVPHHIANGMYGLILVEPEGGLPPVDREFYVMQGEIYTEEAFGTRGHLSFSPQKLLNETPEYFVFNGAAAALAADENALYANVGETVRIYIGVGGPNFISSFHVIGEIFDVAYPFGSFTSEPLHDVQTINVNPGGAWAVDFTLEVPGTFILVDHALSRLERGLVGLLHVEGDAAPEIFKEGPASP